MLLAMLLLRSWLESLAPQNLQLAKPTLGLLFDICLLSYDIVIIFVIKDTKFKILLLRLLGTTDSKTHTFYEPSLFDSINLVSLQLFFEGFLFFHLSLCDIVASLKPILQWFAFALHEYYQVDCDVDHKDSYVDISCNLVGNRYGRDIPLIQIIRVTTVNSVGEYEHTVD